MPKKQKHKPNMEALVANDSRIDTKETDKSNNANIDLSVLKPLILQNMENLKGQRKSKKNNKKRKQNKDAATPEDQVHPSVFDDLNFKLISKEKAILIIKS